MYNSELPVFSYKYSYKNNKKYMKTLFFTLLFACGFFHLAKSQNMNLPKIIPPLPTSAIYQRYAATPPNLSTGTVNINIPLYTLKVDGFELPFSLGYQTSGIKVLDPYYPLGYGWVFMPGLRITRTIMGNADDKAPRFIKDASTLMMNDTEANYLYLKSLVTNNLSDEQDAQYDIYSIHLPTTNARFVMEKVNNTWQAVTIGSAVKITPVLSSKGEFNGFEVKDDHGVIYQFGEVASYIPPTTGTQSSYIEIAPQFRGNTAWMLRKIILPGKDNTISFNWNIGTHETGIKPLDDYYYIDDSYEFRFVPPFSHTICDNLVSDYNPYDHSGYDVYTGNTTNTFPCMYLKDVQFPSGKIEITYGSDKLMKNMQIYSKATGGSYSAVKNIDFNTSNLLRSVTIGQEKYAFEYNESYPSADKSARDWWGYFNGISSPSAIPMLSFAAFDGYITYPFTMGDATRAVDRNKMQQNMLTKVIYPTGGYSKYEYEPHQFNGSVFKEGGGLRVKKIITKASDTAPENTLEYHYGANESGLGICTMEPIASSFFQESYHHFVNPGRLPDVCEYSYRQVILTADSKITNYTSFNPDVWYDEVTEYSSEGKTIYQFEYNADGAFTLQLHSILVTPPTSPSLNYIGDFNNLFKQGPRLRYTKVYKKEAGTYKQLQEEEIQYKFISGHSNLNGLYVERKNYFEDFSEGIYDYFPFAYPGKLMNWITLPGKNLIDISFVFSNYWIIVEAEKIASRIKKYYDPAGNILEQRTDYKYAVQNGVINLSSETSTTSANKTFVKQMLYPLDNLSALTQEQKAATGRMVELNLLTSPLVETQTLDNSTTTKINQYKDWGNNLVLLEKLYLKTGNGVQENRIVYNNYDTHGNPLYISKDNADQVVYLWSYNYQYPIAEIKGATYADVKTALGYTSDTQVESLAAKTDPAADMTTINNLRTKLPNALVTTYTYKPLVGMATMTDPRGVVTKYDYDGFGRLIKVTRADKVIETYDYHYKSN